MLCQGLVDEVSVVVDPSADGSTETQTLFMAAPGLAPVEPHRFHLESVGRVGTGGEQVWLRYSVDNG